jgi:glycosyltransferase involved in cell wall biosynthesis
MTVAYLLNTYPVPSATFIRREIEALETTELDIKRFAVRRWDGTLVDEADKAEQAKVHYLLDSNHARLFGSLLKEILFNGAGILRASPAWYRLIRNAKGGFVRHCAYFMQAAYFRQQSAKLNIEHVHAHYGTNAAAVAMLSRLLGGAPYSFTAHGPDEFNNPEMLSFGEKINHASFVVAISNYCKAQMRDLSYSDDDAQKIQVARCGIGLEDFQFSPMIQPNNHQIVCVGRLCPQKGQIHIPLAASRLRREFPDLRITLVGDGESRAVIAAKIAEHGVEDIVLLHGWASNAEVRRMISESRALLLPSYAEGLPIVLMEALALGRTAITTKIAGISELVDDECGWLIEPGDETQLVDALRECLLSSPEKLAGMVRIGRARVETSHDRKSLATSLRRLFQTAAPA